MQSTKNTNLKRALTHCLASIKMVGLVSEDEKKETEKLWA